MVRNMKESFLMIKLTDMEHYISHMAANIKDNGKKIWNKVKANLFGLTEIFTMDLGLKIKDMDMVFTNGIMEIFIKEIGKIIKEMVKE